MDPTITDEPDTPMVHFGISTIRHRSVAQLEGGPTEGPLPVDDVVLYHATARAFKAHGQFTMELYSNDWWTFVVVLILRAFICLVGLVVVTFSTIQLAVVPGYDRLPNILQTSLTSSLFITAIFGYISLGFVISSCVANVVFIMRRSWKAYDWEVLFTRISVLVGCPLAFVLIIPSKTLTQQLGWPSEAVEAVSIESIRKSTIWVVVAFVVCVLSHLPNLIVFFRGYEKFFIISGVFALLRYVFGVIVFILSSSFAVDKSIIDPSAFGKQVRWQFDMFF